MAAKAAILFAKLAEASGSEVAVKSKGFADSQRPHEGEASPIHKGIFAFVVATEPAKGRRLDFFGDKEQTNSWRTVDGIEKIDRRPMSSAAAEKCPGFAADVITSEKRLCRIAGKKLSCQVVRIVAADDVVDRGGLEVISPCHAANRIRRQRRERLQALSNEASDERRL